LQLSPAMPFFAYLAGGLGLEGRIGQSEPPPTVDPPSKQSRQPADRYAKNGITKRQSDSAAEHDKPPAKTTFGMA
jgi:hypothetical protein